MTISIEDLHRLDTADIGTGERISAVHPGEFLEEIMNELGISSNHLAKSVRVSATQISHIVHGHRPVTAEMALRLGLFFSQSPEYWLGLQTQYDMDMARRMLDRLRKEVTPLHAA